MSPNFLLLLLASSPPPPPPHPLPPLYLDPHHSLLILLLFPFIFLSIRIKVEERGRDGARGIELEITCSETRRNRFSESRLESLARLPRFPLSRMSTADTEVPAWGIRDEYATPRARTSFPTVGGSDLVARAPRKKEGSHASLEQRATALSRSVLK